MWQCCHYYCTSRCFLYRLVWVCDPSNYWVWGALLIWACMAGFILILFPKMLYSPMRLRCVPWHWTCSEWRVFPKCTFDLWAMHSIQRCGGGHSLFECMVGFVMILFIKLYVLPWGSGVCDDIGLVQSEWRVFQIKKIENALLNWVVGHAFQSH